MLLVELPNTCKPFFEAFYLLLLLRPVFLLLGDLTAQSCVLLETFSELLLQVLALIHLLLRDVLELQSSLFDEVDHRHSLLHFPFDIEQSFLELVFLILSVFELSPEFIKQRAILRLSRVLNLLESIFGLLEFGFGRLLLHVLLLDVCEHPSELVCQVIQQGAHVYRADSLQIRLIFLHSSSIDLIDNLLEAPILLLLLFIDSTLWLRPACILDLLELIFELTSSCDTLLPVLVQLLLFSEMHSVPFTRPQQRERVIALQI